MSAIVNASHLAVGLFAFWFYISSVGANTE